MTVGEKIKKIRTFRGMTQKELGLAVGFEEKGADNRIAQYETNYRVPKKDLLNKIAEVLPFLARTENSCAQSTISRIHRSGQNLKMTSEKCTAKSE